MWKLPVSANIQFFLPPLPPIEFLFDITNFRVVQI